MTQIDKSRIIRDAATVILLRSKDGQDQVLMGQRGSRAAFMPDKFVFPGGAVDAGDYHVTPALDLPEPESARLSAQAPDKSAQAVAMAAVRELWEETGLRLGVKGAAPKNTPEEWQGFYETGLVPRADVFRFVFRAVTPPGRTRRFDARFLVADSDFIVGDLDDFSGASDELSLLHWIDLSEAKTLDLPFITTVVLAEVMALRAQPDAPRKVPFFHHDEQRSHFSLL